MDLGTSVISDPETKKKNILILDPFYLLGCTWVIRAHMHNEYGSLGTQGYFLYLSKVFVHPFLCLLE